ncbi:MAG: Gfo/Idh/MocA family protein [Cloacibacillus evryensis]
MICEKPLTGYFGEPGDLQLVGEVGRRQMYDVVTARLERLREAVKKSGLLFMYAENWIYAPAVAKTAEILRASKDKIMLMKADESHSGAHTRLADEWKNSGGGALIRQGCHPLSAVLFLKRTETAARGEAYSVRDVYGDVGTALKNLSGGSARSAQPRDVEDTGMMQLTFGDGTKATVFASDAIPRHPQHRRSQHHGRNTYCNICQNNCRLLRRERRDAEGYLRHRQRRDETRLSVRHARRGVVRGQIQEFRTSWNASPRREPLSGIDIARDGAADVRRLPLGGRGTETPFRGL